MHSGMCQQKFSITNEETIKLAEWCLQIEKYFSAKHGHYQPMDIEWAVEDGKLYMLQARPITTL